MKIILEYLKDNKEWIFSGIGIAIVGFIFSKQNKTNSIKIVAKNKSKVYHAGRDLKIKED
jgi:hypothetical protein